MQSIHCRSRKIESIMNALNTSERISTRRDRNSLEQQNCFRSTLCRTSKNRVSIKDSSNSSQKNGCRICGVNSKNRLKKSQSKTMRHRLSKTFTLLERNSLNLPYLSQHNIRTHQPEMKQQIFLKSMKSQCSKRITPSSLNC